VRDGAAEVLEAALAADDPKDSAPALGAAVSVALAREHGVSATVFMAYADGLRETALWFRQLWAESLGKQGRGTTPIDAVGTVDQHSQLQLWLDGPADKMFTIVTAPSLGQGDRTDPAMLSRIPELDWLAGRTLGDLLDAHARGTADALAAAGRPVRTMRLNAVDAPSLGEQGKIRARAYMDETRGTER
jgi:glucose-6-phosphate isomerase